MKLSTVRISKKESGNYEYCICTDLGRQAEDIFIKSLSQ